MKLIFGSEGKRWTATFIHNGKKVMIRNQSDLLTWGQWKSYAKTKANIYVRQNEDQATPVR